MKFIFPGCDEEVEGSFDKKLSECKGFEKIYLKKILNEKTSSLKIEDQY